MGQEAACFCELGGARVAAMAYLEAGRLLLRSASARFVVASPLLESVEVVDKGLRFSDDHSEFVVELNSAVAARWYERITSPPTLAEKLGLADRCHAFVLGCVSDSELTQALSGFETKVPSDAGVLLGIVCDPSELHKLIEVHKTVPQLPLWVVHQKGKASRFSGDKVRSTLRALGLRDNKVCSVSAGLSAIRFVAPRVK